jgi:Lon protease-like protein
MRPLPELIPLFPLPNVVLFPQVPLPLHVFEPRYRKMVLDVQRGHQTIGMTLLQPGWEIGYHGRPPIYPIGCAGQLESCEPLENGRYNIVLKGLARFRILEEHAGEPYRLATIAQLPEDQGPLVELAGARRELLAMLARLQDGPAVIVVDGDVSHDVFVNTICQSLSLTPVERQSLLDCDGVLVRYRRLIEILEFKLLERTYGGGRGNLH